MSRKQKKDNVLRYLKKEPVKKKNPPYLLFVVPKSTEFVQNFTDLCIMYNYPWYFQIPSNHGHSHVSVKILRQSIKILENNV